MSLKSYAEAINEAHRQLLASDERVFIIGQGVESPWCVGTTTLGLVSSFGHERVIDVPIFEAGMTGAAIGAAMAGMRPIVFHPRMDFMYLAMDQIANHGANWHYMFGGQIKVPVTIRGIINRGNEQASQHSQSPFAIYAHIPGLKLVCPASPYDAKGLLAAAVQDDNPVIYCDDRWLYGLEEEVPDELYTIPLGKARICRPGSDATVVAISYLVPEALQAAATLEKQSGLSIEVIDPRTLKPLDMESIIDSVRKTGRLLIADPDWPVCSISGHIASRVYEELYGMLKAPIARINFPEAPVPASSSLEEAYYPRSSQIIIKVLELTGKSNQAE